MNSSAPRSITSHVQQRLRRPSRATGPALWPEARATAHWLIVEWLPRYAPELNDVERVWYDLKAHHLAHQTFAHPGDHAICQAIGALAAERTTRTTLPLAELRISA